MDILVVEAQTFTSDPETCVLISDTSGVIGNVVFDSAKNIGMSKEAFDAMITLRRGRDAIGDLDWFSSTKHGQCFSWLGGLKAIFPVSALSTGRDFKLGDYVEIPNDVPSEAILAIDGM